MTPIRSFRNAAAVLLVASSVPPGCVRTAAAPDAVANDDRARADAALADSANVVREMTGAGDIPPRVRERARCIVVVPSMVHGGLVVSARRGAGVATCRRASGWSGPAFVTIRGGGAGAQIGVESSDVVMLVTTQRDVSQLFQSRFVLGAGTSVAAGPVGHAAEASTDAELSAGILSYAHSRGIFAGVALAGAILGQDRAAMNAIYGGGVDGRAVLLGKVAPPIEARDFLDAVATAFPP